MTLDLVGAFAELVKDMIVSFSGSLEGDPTLFEEVVDDSAAGDLPTGIKVDLDVFPEAATVIIPDRLGIPKCFEHGVCLKDLLLDLRFGCFCLVA